ncbi:MAG: HIT domain-containing protein [Gammaproteobacteria bacterium]|nr:HIT domain-containing protein [Gammaproteobacteria bacterium]
MSFTIDAKLVTDTIRLGSFPLCDLLLMNDSRFPWVILVPKIPDLQDFHEIPTEFRDVLFQEIEATSNAIQKLWSVDKMNVAALGNQVSQLHIHVIGRRRTDDAWPSPVWGHGTPHPYTTADRPNVVQSLAEELKLRD